MRELGLQIPTVDFSINYFPAETLPCLLGNILPHDELAPFSGPVSAFDKLVPNDVGPLQGVEGDILDFVQEISPMLAQDNHIDHSISTLRREGL